MDSRVAGVSAQLGIMEYGVSERFGSCLEHGCAHTDEHSLWSRRNFLTSLGQAIGSSIVLGSTTINALASSPMLDMLHRHDSERILVLLQLGGGNDGLNTIIPVEDGYYFRARPTLSIPKRVALPLTDTLGLHPALNTLRGRYDDGQMAIIQGVGYKDSSLSHFDGTDNWMSGTTSVGHDASGWVGRKLEFSHPDFETKPREYPLAVQVGGISSRLFDGRENGMGMTMANVEVFRRLVRTGRLFDENTAPDNAYGNEVAFVRRIANDTFTYGRAVQEAAARAGNAISYPRVVPAYLTDRLSIVARLIKGGLGARVYHVGLGGFDTHGSQGSVYGRHATLLKAMAETVNAFLNDLGELSKEVLIMTFSEFGRRVNENGSDGTDHGTAAPLFLFGPGVKGGILGDTPSLRDLDAHGNLKYGIDFRAVYSTVLQHWFGFTGPASAQVLGESFDPLDIIANPSDPTYTGAESTAEVPDSFVLHQNYPNPFNPATTIEYRLGVQGRVTLDVIDLTGRRVETLVDRTQPPGQYSVQFDAAGLPSGTYLYRLRVGTQVASRRMLLLR